MRETKSAESITVAEIAAWIVARLRTELELDADHVTEEASFIDLGLSSINATGLAFEIEEEFATELPATLLWECANSLEVARRVHREVSRRGAAAPGHTPALSDVDELSAAMTLSGSIRPEGPMSRSSEAEVLLLTGATGYLGAHLLDELLAQPKTARVVCLVRAADPASGMERIVSNLEAHRRWKREHANRIEVVAGDFSQPNLGLDAKTWTRMAEEVELIVHNGAQLNHTLPYAVLKNANADACHEILRLAARRRTKPVHFVSTLALFAAPGFLGSTQSVSEREELAFDRKPVSGYLLSKWVADKLMADACAKGIPTTTYRVPLLGPSSRTGLGNRADILARVILACLQERAAPDLDSRIELVQVDYAARGIAALLRRDTSTGATFHITHPQPPTWNQLVDLASRKVRVRRIPYDEWKRRIRQRVERKPESPLYPLVRLLRPSEARAESITTLQIMMLGKLPPLDSGATTAQLVDAGVPSAPIDSELLTRYLLDLIEHGVEGESSDLSLSTDPMERLRTLFDAQELEARADPELGLGERRRALDGIAVGLLERQGDLCRAVAEDYGARSNHETLLEIFSSVNALRYASRHLASWMKPERKSVDPLFLPARATIRYQSKGVVGIIAPWNYPVFLSMSPLAGALAAGNRVLIKPSELTPRTGKVLEEIVSAVVRPDHVAVINGDRDLGPVFSALPFDHLLFTGSTDAGRKIMESAAANLTPVTLELGGKTPTLIDGAFPMARAAKSIMAGKLLNAGQTCVAPDYVLLPRDRLDEFVDLASKATRKLYPTLAENPDYSNIISQGHLDTLRRHIEEARAAGAEIIELIPFEERDVDLRSKFPPTLVVHAPDSVRLMQDEIFGPILPLVPYESIDDAIEYVKQRPRPLALYLFSNDKELRERVAVHTISGGMCVNDTVMHVGQEGLPFGGVGASGMGEYHGHAGFVTFSKRKPVFVQSRINGVGLLRPPYGRAADLTFSVLLRPPSRLGARARSAMESVKGRILTRILTRGKPADPAGDDEQ